MTFRSSLFEKLQLAVRREGQPIRLRSGQAQRAVIYASDQSVAASYAYDEFGNLVSDTGTLDQPYRFSTKRFYDGVGLSYYGYRFYSASLGRWLSRDPLGEEGGLNLYAAMGNSALNLIDPWGLKIERGLTPQEIHDAEFIFGDSIDYSKVTLYIDDTFIGMPKNKAVTLGNSIFIGPDYYELGKGYTGDTANDRALLIHELTHVYQYHHRLDVIISSAIAQIFGDPYNVNPCREESFFDYNVEERASILADFFYYLLNGKDVSIYIHLFEEFQNDISGQ